MFWNLFGVQLVMPEDLKKILNSWQGKESTSDYNTLSVLFGQYGEKRIHTYFLREGRRHLLSYMKSVF